MALDVVLDKDGSAHHISQSSSLFHLIKKTTLDENRSLPQSQGGIMLGYSSPNCVF